MNIFLSILWICLIAHPGDKPEVRGWLGIEVEDLTSPMRSALATDYGVLVNFVSSNSPAEQGGIKVGDVILAFNSEKIYERSDLEYLVRRNPGKNATITILRRGEKKDLDIKIGSVEYEAYWLKIPPIRFPEDLERMLRNLKPKWEEEMGDLRREIDRLKREVDSLRKEIEKRTKI